MASRIEDILTAILNDGTYTDEPQSRIEAILLAILNQTTYTAEAQSRIEAILLCILNGTDLGIVPQSRVETILECIYNGEAYTGDTQSRIEELLKQISEKEPTPPTPITFTATFVRADGDGGGTLYTQSDIPAGTAPVYGGETPTTTKGSAADYPFKGWTPALAPITEDTVYTAVFGLAGETIDDDWSTILANPNYATDYSIGDTKAIDLGSEGTHLMEIVAFNEDNRADGTGKAGITWISKTLLNTARDYNTNATKGWQESGLRSVLNTTIKALIPETVRNAIVPVTKISSAIGDGGVVIKNGQVTTDEIWIPSAYEVSQYTTDFEDTGARYWTKFSNAGSRIKNLSGTASHWWLRSAYGSPAEMNFVFSSGSVSHTGVAYYRKFGVALGFCTN